MSQTGGVGGPQSRRAVASVGRAELEDRHISLLEENHLLKKHARCQEEKMKKMATKLLRLAADERREARRDGQPTSVVQVRELEGEIQELTARIRDLERTNASLRHKMALLRQQCGSKSHRKTAYDHVQSRISSGIGKRVQRSSAQSSPATPRYGRSLLEEARRDNQELEDLVLRLKQKVSVLTAENEKNQELVRLQTASHEQDKLGLEQQLQTLSTTHKKRGIEEDVEVIRVQREVREKSDRLLVLDSQYSALERNMEAMRVNQSKLLQEMEHLNTRLKEEQTRAVGLQTRLNSESVTQGRLAELEQRVSDLTAEKEILKKTNDRLMDSAFVEDRGSEYRGQVRALQERIRELERSRETQLTTSARAVHVPSSTREESGKFDGKFDGELREAGGAYNHIQTQHQQLKEVQARGRRMDGEVKADKHNAAANTAQDGLEHGKTHLHRELFELRLSQEEAAAELEKTRQLLTAQRVVNQDYQKEVKALRDHICQLQTHHHLPERLSDQHLENCNTPLHTKSPDSPQPPSGKELKSRGAAEQIATRPAVGERESEGNLRVQPQAPSRGAERPVLAHEPGDGRSSGRGCLERGGVSEIVSEEEEEMKEDVSVSSSTQSSSEMGTPSTSTPLRPPLPPPSPGAQDTPPPLPPFSSSLSVISEPPASAVEPHPPTGRGGSVTVGGSGEGGSGDSVSVTVTELSDEEEDTMFEETLPNYTTESMVSGRTLATPTTPTRPSIRLASEDDEEGSPPVSPSLTSGVSPSISSLDEVEAATTREDVMSVSIERFSPEPACSLASQEDISGYFVEFQLLDYDYGELETPSVLVSTHPSLPVVFNFRKEFHVSPSQKSLLASALSSSTDNSDRKVLFTVVSDPVDQERDCEEVGTAELDLSTIWQSGKDIVNQQIEVVGCDEDLELVGLLTVSVSATHILRHL